MTRDEILAVAKPILFNTEMMRAILEGRKTVTRRAIKPQPLRTAVVRNSGGVWDWAIWANDGIGYPMNLPYKPGDYLYVRETWVKLPVSHGDHFRPNGVYYYKVDEELRPERFVRNGWHPSIHMPKEAARLFLRVTKVRAERLQEISPHDAQNEGIKFRPFNDNFPHFKEWLIKDFRDLWDSTIKKVDLPIYGWEANPWVWVIEFQKVEANRNAG